MKTLQIVGSSPVGGGTYLLLKWCQFLVDQGCQVDVLSTDPDTIERLEAIPNVNVMSHIHIPRGIEPLAITKGFFQLSSFLRREKYDVVHSYSSMPGILGRIGARLAGIPVIVHHQAGWSVNDWSTWLRRLIYTPVEYVAVMASTRSICVSSATVMQAKQFRIAPQHKLALINNGINPQPFLEAIEHNAGAALRRELGCSDGCLLFGNIGRLAAPKEYDVLIRSLVPLSKLIDRPFLVLIVGTGPDRESLEQLAQELGVSERVRFLGFRTDIAAILSAMDMFVGPTLWEGLSVSILEAMATARPIITTAIPANLELIEHEVTGLLVDTGSPDQIAEAIVRFVHDPELARRCAQAAQQRLLNHYTLDRMLDETWALYKQLSAAGRSHRYV